VTTELALKWNCDPTPRPPQPLSPSFVITGTGSLDPGFAYLQTHFAYPSAPVRLIIDTQDRVPLLWTPSPARFLVWRPHDRWRHQCWQTLQGIDAGTGSVNFSPASPSRSASQMRVERLARIQASLGVSLQDLAGVLAISRAQLYKWLDPERDIQLQEESRTRLSRIEQFAAHWASVSVRPLSTLAHEPLPGGFDIVSLMSATRLNVSAIMTALNQLAGRMDTGRKSITEGMRDRGFRRRPSARSLPSDA
jgi:transcriptional regulator with XRE-family HTH domain